MKQTKHRFAPSAKNLRSDLSTICILNVGTGSGAPLGAIAAPSTA